MLPQAWGALLIGSVAGILSTFGFNVLQGVLERKFGLRDTCGINNLHGMPSIFGALCSVVIAAISSHEKCMFFRLIVTHLMIVCRRRICWLCGSVPQ
jgi:ammonia channel protein AmtB